MKSSVNKPPARPPHIALVPNSAVSSRLGKPRRFGLFGLVLIGIVAAVLGTYALYARPWAGRPISVPVETAQAGPVIRAIAVNGRIAARALVELSPGAAGRIVAISVDQGDVVAAGDILARQEDASQRAVVRQAFSSLDVGIVRQQQARATVASDRALAGNVTQSTLQADTRLLAEADSEVDRLQGLLDQAQFQLGLITVLSPMRGTVVARSAEVGQVTTTQSVLFTVADLTRLVVQTNVDELYASQVKLGQDALLLPAGQTDALPGSVTRLSPQIDQSTGGMAIELSFTVPQVLPLGMTVTANIVVEQSPNALAVPRSAIVSGSSVYLLRADRAVLVPVTIIEWPSDRLVVTAGLSPGDVVITELAGLSNGVSVAARRD